MSSTSIVCPHCGKEIELSQALTHSIEERLSRQLEKDYRNRLQESKTQIREKALGELTPALEELKSQLLEKEKKLKESANAELQLRKEKEALLERAAESLREGQPEQAGELYSALLARDPDDRDALAGRVKALLDRGLWAEAVEEGRRARVVHPQDPGVVSALGSALFRAGLLDECESVLGPLAESPEALLVPAEKGTGPPGSGSR